MSDDKRAPKEADREARPMTRKLAIQVTQAIGALLAFGFCVSTVVPAVYDLAVPDPTAPVSGIVLDDDLREAINGHFVLWIAECESPPVSFEDARLCNIGPVEVDQATWEQYSRGDQYP